jgi:hypothetical protein
MKVFENAEFLLRHGGNDTSRTVQTEVEEDWSQTEYWLRPGNFSEAEGAPQENRA